MSYTTVTLATKGLQLQSICAQPVHAYCVGSQAVKTERGVHQILMMAEKNGLLSDLWVCFKVGIMS